jgi:hypothetical protein
MKTKAGVLFLLAGAALGTAACGPAPIRPLSFPDPSVPCPAGLISWKLDILDRRPTTEGGEAVMESLRRGVQDSFPGCRWSAGPAGPEAGTPTITIEVHRLGVQEHNRYQDAAAEWTVTVASSSGSTMTQFEANEEESRPAYSGADEEALNDAFRKALQRTVRGLAAMQRLGSFRPRKGTVSAVASARAPAPRPAVSR